MKPHERLVQEQLRCRATGEHRVLEARGMVRGDVFYGECDAPGLPVPKEVGVVRDAGAVAPRCRRRLFSSVTKTAGVMKFASLLCRRVDSPVPSWS